MCPGLRFITASVLACTLTTVVSLSQSTFGSIIGTVTDPTSALVPTAEVEVINEGTGTTRRVVTGSAGVFNVTEPRPWHL